MMQFNTHSFLDSFIWAIPILLTLPLKPIVEYYIKTFTASVCKYIDQIVVGLIAASAGHYIVTCSTFFDSIYDVTYLPISFSV